MADVHIARRYARALHELAAAEGAQDAVFRDLEQLDELLSGEGAELYRALTSPVFSTDERGKVLGEVLSRLGAHALTGRFLTLLLTRDRFTLIAEVTKVFVELADDVAGRVRVTVATVDPLTPELEAELMRSFQTATGKQVILQASIDPSLIGGLVARVGSRVYDASLRTRLESLKQRLIHAQVVPEA